MKVTIILSSLAREHLSLLRKGLFRNTIVYGGAVKKCGGTGRSNLHDRGAILDCWA